MFNSGNFRHLLQLTRPRICSRKHSSLSKSQLERSSTTNPPKISPSGLGRSTNHGFIFTLDPNQLAKKKQQRLDISGLFSLTPRIILAKRLRPVISTRLYYRPPSAVNFIPFPPKKKAFLYFATLPGKPRIAGELRLRVTSSDDPASFPSGSDLLRKDRQPWSCSLYALSIHHPPLYEKLREEGLVSDDLARVLSTLPLPESIHGQIISALDDTFTVDFTRSMLTLTVLTDQGMEKLQLFQLFESGRARIRPYAGRASVRFERSTLPDHEGTRTVVLRFLKMIKPVKCVVEAYDGQIASPKAGELHKKAHNLHMQPWSINIDTTNSPTMARLFRLLWDT